MPYDPTLTSDYCTALEAFRAGDARPFKSYAAGVLHAASVLLDPGGVMFLGADPTAGDQYDVVNSRVWKRFCDAERDGGLEEQQVLEILLSEYGSNFGGRSRFVEGLDGEVTIESEYEGTAADAPEGTAEMAALVWRRLCEAEGPLDREERPVSGA